MSNSIDQLIQDCTNGFGDLLGQVENPPIAYVNKIDEFAPLKTLISRFTRWSRNAGAESLDQKLQNKTRVKLQVIRLLSHTQRLLDDALAIIVGTQVPWDRIEEEEQDSQLEEERQSLDISPETEIDQILAHIDDAIDNLSYLNPALRGPFADDARTDETSPFEPFDIQHVRSKHPEIDSAIAERLGKAISVKRQIFKYRQDNKSQRPTEQSPHNHSYSPTVTTQILETLMSQVALENPIPQDDKASESEPELSSETSCSDVGYTRVSQIPELSYEATEGTPFRCVCCQEIIEVSSVLAWKKHVYKDLRPYVCLEEDCSIPQYQYARRSDWMKHVIEEHWRLYSCPFGCDPRFTARSESREHLHQYHGDKTSRAEIEDLVQLGTFNEAQIPKETSCPFCKIPLQSIRAYQSHVGRHQIALALFALPRNTVEEGTARGIHEVGQPSTHDTALDISDIVIQGQAEKEELSGLDGQSDASEDSLGTGITDS
ncbi:hypothetical protein F52700_6755 [Fusarium sp. NRRL 52700]|nr:hypothetical protein F52700_6755 [Fusarium sp. NRRL 52700]